MITFDGIIFSARSRMGGISVYFRELIKRAAAIEPYVSVLVHEPSVTASELGCARNQVILRKARVLERYRSVPDIPGGVLHSSYYRSCNSRYVHNAITVYDFTYEHF